MLNKIWKIKICSIYSCDSKIYTTRLFTLNSSLEVNIYLKKKNMRKIRHNSKKRSIYRSESLALMFVSLVMMIVIIVLFFIGILNYESLIPLALFGYIFGHNLYMFSLYKSLIDKLRAMEEEDEQLDY